MLIFLKTFLSNVYYYCLLKYFMFFSVRLFFWLTPFLIGLICSLIFGGDSTVLAQEPDLGKGIILIDRLPHNYQKDEAAFAQKIREQLSNTEAHHQIEALNFDFTNLKDRGSNVLVQYEEELRPYMWKKTDVDVSHVFAEKKPRKPFLDYVTPTNTIIAVVVFVGAVMLLGYADEVYDLRSAIEREQKEIDAELAMHFADVRRRWEDFKAFFGGPSVE